MRQKRGTRLLGTGTRVAIHDRRETKGFSLSMRPVTDSAQKKNVKMDLIEPSHGAPSYTAIFRSVDLNYKVTKGVRN